MTQMVALCRVGGAHWRRPMHGRRRDASNGSRGGRIKTVTLKGHWVDPPNDSVYFAPDCHFEAPPPGAA